MDERLIQKVEAYFRRTMTDEERIGFEQELKRNPELKNLYDEYRISREIVDMHEEDVLRTKFAGWNKNSNRGKSKTLVIILSAAASVILLAGLFYFFTPKISYSQRLADRYYELPQTPGYTMGGGNQNWSGGIEFYKEGSFKKAAAKWETIQDPDAEASYYLAHCYFNTKQFDKAIPIFRELSAGTSAYSIPSGWFLTLSYLANDQSDKAKMQLKKILSGTSHPYYAKAQKLNAELNK